MRWQMYRMRRNLRRLTGQRSWRAHHNALQRAITQVQSGDLFKYARKVSDVFGEYLGAWFDADKNTTALMERRPEIRHQIELFLSKQRGVLLPSGDGPSEITYPSALHLPPKTEAAGLLLKVITNQFYSRVQRCDRCKRIYVQKTNYRNKRFCHRMCGNAARQQRPSVAAAERERLAVAKKALGHWLKSRAATRGEDWKRWIHIKTGLSLNWLTRRARSGCIYVPDL